MSLAALEAVVKSYQEQPLGLEKGCVEEGGIDGKVYVDARFTNNGKLEVVPNSSCTSEHYVVRFDHTAFVPSPSKDVILLMVWTHAPPAWEFNAVIEVPDWPKRRPGVMTMSPCGSAFGVLQRANDRWAATVVPPPRSPDAL